MTDTPDTEPGARRKGETDVAYEAFRCYLEQGPTRSLAKVGSALGKSETLMSRWSSRWEWTERVRAVESGDGAAVDDERRTLLAERAKRQAQIAQLHGEASALVSAELVKRITKDPSQIQAIPTDELVRLSASMARAHKGAVISERLALGMSTEQGAEDLPRDVAAAHAAKLTEDELDAKLAGVDELTEARTKKAARKAAGA
jgi:hypothetical protein